MAIAFDAASTGSTTGAGTYLLSHATSGSNRALVVCVVADNTSDLVTGATYAGTAMTLVNKVKPSAGRWVYGFALMNPASGANNIGVTVSSSSYIEVNAASYTGVQSTSNPEANNTNSSGGATSLATAVTTLTDMAWVIGCASHQAGTLTAGSGTTKRVSGTVGGLFDSGGAVTPAGSKTLNHSGASSAQCGMVVMSLVPDSTPAESITVDSPVTRKVFQRSGSTGSITISGTVAGSTEDIEASFNGGAYVTIASAVAPGSFSGTLTGQAQGQGTLTVRKKTTTSTSTTVSLIGIGDVFLVCGDSISEGRATNAQSYTHATLQASKFTQADVWGDGQDPIDTGTNIGSHWPLLATQIMADQSVPVAFISAGTGSTDVAGSANTWAKPGTEYTNAAQQVTDSGVNAVRAVLMHLGPNAVVNATTLSQATYNAAIDTLAANWAADIAGAPKLHVGIFGEVSTGSPPDRRAAIDNIRAAIVEAQGDNANVKPGPCLIDLDYTDGVHPQSDAALATVAKRWWVALKESLYGGSGGRGPRLSSAVWNGARNQLTVTFDRALKTGLTHSTGAWSISDNGSAMAISGIAYHGSDAAALVISTSAAATGAAGTTTVTFASGLDSVGLVVPLSADITMPSGAAIQIPAEPIYAAAVAEVDVTAPTLSSPSFTGTGATTGTASVSTNEANGTLYCVVTTGSTPPTAAQVRAGQDSAGAAASYASSVAVSSTGTKNFSATGLSAGTTYYAHFTHRDASSNDSTVATSSGDATDGSASVTVRLVDRNGTPQTGVSGIYWALLSGLPATATILAQGTGETTDGSGNLVIDASASGLSAGDPAWLLITDGAAAPDTKGRVIPVTVA